MIHKEDIRVELVINEPRTDESQLQKRTLQLRAPMMVLLFACAGLFDLILGTCSYVSNLLYIGSKGPSLIVLRQDAWFWYGSDIWISAMLAPILVNPIARLFQDRPFVTFADCMFPWPPRVRRYARLTALLIFGTMGVLDPRIHTRLTDTAVIEDWLWGAKVHPYSDVRDVAIGPYRVTSGRGRYYYATAVFITFKDGSTWSPQKAYSDIGRQLTYRIAGVVSEHSGVRARYSDPDNLLGPSGY